MATRFLILAGIAPAMMLAGCGNTGFRGLESPNQPVVTRADYALDLQTSGDTLAPGEAQRLAGWMNSLNLGYGDRVSVENPGGYADGAHEAIADAVAQHGLLLGDDAPVVPGSVAPGTVRVVVMRMSAHVPGCPDYRDAGEPNFDEHTSADFGCATNSNLAAMIARPSDLVSGQSRARTSDPDTAVKAIDGYRAAPLTGAAGLKEQSTTAGSGSR